MKKMLLLVSVSIVFTLSCATTETDNIIVEDNLMYYHDEDYELYLDIAYPAGGGKHPVLIFILESEWGYDYDHRSQFYQSIKLAAEHGYVAITIDHRKVGTNRLDGRKGFIFPAHLEDIQHAADWLVDNRRKYKIDKNRFGMVGWCTGGHLCMMHAFSENEYPEIKAVVNIGGSTDFLAEPMPFGRLPNVLPALLGGTADDIPECYAEASPVNHLTPDDPPVYTIHGDANKKVPVEQAYILDAKMHEVGVSHKLKIVPNGIHMRTPMNDEMWEFLDTYLKR